jgi:hypothetical protein
MIDLSGATDERCDTGPDMRTEGSAGQSRSTRMIVHRRLRRTEFTDNCPRCSDRTDIDVTDAEDACGRQDAVVFGRSPADSGAGSAATGKSPGARRRSAVAAGPITGPNGVKFGPLWGGRWMRLLGILAQAPGARRRCASAMATPVVHALNATAENR